MRAGEGGVRTPDALNRPHPRPSPRRGEGIRSLHASSVSRAEPRGCQRAEGARAPKRCDLVMLEAAFRRPRAVLAVPRVQHRLQRAFGPTRGFLGRRAFVVQDLWRLRCSIPEPRRCRRASVRPIAGRAQPRSPAPESEDELSSRRRCERKATPPQPGTDPAPLQTLSCCVPRWARMRAVWGRKWRRGLVSPRGHSHHLRSASADMIVPHTKHRPRIKNGDKFPVLLDTSHVLRLLFAAIRQPPAEQPKNCVYARVTPSDKEIPYAT